MIKIKILNKELSLKEAEEIYFELYKLFGSKYNRFDKKDLDLYGPVVQGKPKRDIKAPHNEIVSEGWLAPNKPKRNIDDYFVLLKGKLI